MMGNSSSSPTTKPFGVQDQMTSNTQQAVPVAYIAGTRKVAIKWITPVYNLFSKPAPARSGKK
jgi:hypothetical protein